MKHVLICLLVLFSAKVSLDAEGRERKAKSQGPTVVELTLHPMKAAEPNDKYRLLPRAEELSDSDAVALYEKAVAVLPKDVDHKKIIDQMHRPLDQLEPAQAESTLLQFKRSLELVGQAAKCKKCQWPVVKPPAQPVGMNEYWTLARVLAVEARLQMAEGEYDKAFLTLQTGFAMGKHIGNSPILWQGLIGIAIAATMAKQVEEFIESPGAPNLYHCLAALPRPLVDVNKGIDAEMANLESNKQYNWLTRAAMKRQLKLAHDRVRIIMKKLDRQVAALQCIEALRLYAASNEGKLPDALDEITEVKVPDDPVAEKPFIYRRTGSKAVLEAPAPKGGAAEDAMQYTLTLKE